MMTWFLSQRSRRNLVRNRVLRQKARSLVTKKREKMKSNRVVIVKWMMIKALKVKVKRK